ARAAGATYRPDALRRVRETPPLHGARPGERRVLLAGAFAAAPVAGCIILVDDVLTTGATALTAASALRAAGAAEVRALVVARA
ncbi:MAG: ComF family protein, partial [Candidatus Sericytochromatia bacterium]|nr:ComF family protein [Candidatus Tanganyikabacteria bacterium]